MGTLITIPVARLVKETLTLVPIVKLSPFKINNPPVIATDDKLVKTGAAVISV